MPVKIRRATPEDAEQLTIITIAAKRHWNYPEKWIQLWLPQLTISAEYILKNETWMVVEDGVPVGYCSLKQDGEYLWLDNLWVLPEFIGQGLGRQLFQHALTRSRVRNMSTLKIEADPNAQSFYEKMGARKVDEQRHAEMDGRPRILPIMEIDL